MKKASLICIGNELLSGDTVDTNSAWLAKGLLKFSIPVAGIFKIGDDIKSIVRALEQGCEAGDIIIITGGLGPTDDDITRDGVAEFLGVQMQYHENLWRKIESYFTGRGLAAAEKNKVQAYLPAGAVPLENNLGTAPGFKIEFNGKTIAALPGVPSEMKRMFNDCLAAEFQKLSDNGVIKIKKVKLFGTGESAIAEILGDLMVRGRNPLINCTVSCGIITLYIIASADDEQTSKRMIDKDLQKIRSILSDYVFGYDEDGFEDIIGRLLKENGKTLSIAESCTGGLIAKMITDVPGASEYFSGGWITYSNQAKISQLGVDKDAIEKFGAVSGEVARQMAIGAKVKSGSDYSIAVTGIAGPGGGTQEKPVGLVYIAIAGENCCDVSEFRFSRDRQFIRLRTAQTALNLLRKKIS